MNRATTMTRRLLLGAASTAAWLGESAAQAKRQNGRVPNPVGGQLLNTCEGLPYAAQGEGTPLYTFGYSSCPYCLAFHREWARKLQGVQIRWIMYGIGIDPRTVDQSADIALTRDPSLVNAYFDRARIAPSVQSSDLRIEAFNRVGQGTEILKSVLAQEGFFGLVSPTFVWRNPQGASIFMGYTNSLFTRAEHESNRFTL